MIALGICGPIGSGKTTLANLLIGFGWQRLRFADLLKSMLRVLFLCQGAEQDLIDRMLDGDLKEVPTELLNGATPRYAMQTLGTEWRDLISTTLWSDTWLRTVKSFSPNAKIVTDDLRFWHELEAIRQVKASYIVRIIRPGLALASSQIHDSETYHSHFPVNIEIINHGPPHGMLDQLATVVEYWK